MYPVQSSSAFQGNTKIPQGQRLAPSTPRRRCSALEHPADVLDGDSSRDAPWPDAASQDPARASRCPLPKFSIEFKVTGCFRTRCPPCPLQHSSVIRTPDTICPFPATAKTSGTSPGRPSQGPQKPPSRGKERRGGFKTQLSGDGCFLCRKGFFPPTGGL